MREAYQYQWMPKLVLSSSFNFGDEDFKTASLVDDPDVLRKCASSKVVEEWGDIKPVKNASLIHLIAMGAKEATGHNRNGDGWMEQFLKSAHPTFQTHGALYRDHANKDYSKRHGDILKTAYNNDMGRVELLVQANHDKCADWLDDIDRGKRVDFSMGFDCKYDVCEICKNKAKTRRDYCEHVKRGAKHPFGMGRILEDGRKCAVDNPEGVFNDISKVGTGADMIAQQLRKVAGLGDEEVPGGAELMEVLGIKSAADMTVKMAIAYKCSRMEKQVPAVGHKLEGPVRISQKLAQKLRGFTPNVMFAEMAKVGAVLSFRDFFQFVMADRYDDAFANQVEAAEPKFAGYFSSLVEDRDRLDAVIANDTYNCAKFAYSHLSDGERRELAAHYSIDPELAEERLVANALYGREIVEKEGLAQKQAHSLDFLLDEYAAYKLAALEGTDWVMDDDVIRTAVLLS